MSPFFPCCLWQEEQAVGCETYRFERRPSQDCVAYQSPYVGMWNCKPGFFLIREDYIIIIVVTLIVYSVPRSYRVRRSSCDHVWRFGIYFQRQRWIRISSRGFGKVQVRRPRKIRTVARKHTRPRKGDHADLGGITRQHVNRDRGPITTQGCSMEVQVGRIRWRKTGVFRPAGAESTTFSR